MKKPILHFFLVLGLGMKSTLLVKVMSIAQCIFKRILLQIDHITIAERFEYSVGRKLDLVCLNTADIIISAQVIATGEEIFAKSEQQLNGYRAHVMSRYFDFKRSRKIIEDNILVRPNHGR